MEIEFIIRVMIAALLGGIIGLEREYRAKEAGFRTHFLVGLGAALFMVISQYGFNTILGQTGKASFDPSRIASQVVTGIGFIGAGTIIFQKHVVRGLTTAAGLWVTSAIGLTVGAGMYVLAITATLLCLLCLEAMNFFLARFGTRAVNVCFSSREQAKIQQVMSKLIHENVDIDAYEMKQQNSPSGNVFMVTMELKIKRAQYQTRIFEFIQEFDGVSIESIE